MTMVISPKNIQPFLREDNIDGEGCRQRAKIKIIFLEKVSDFCHDKLRIDLDKNDRIRFNGRECEIYFNKEKIL